MLIGGSEIQMLGLIFHFSHTYTKLLVKLLPEMFVTSEAETYGTREDCSTLAWKIPWMEEPGRL